MLDVKYKHDSAKHNSFALFYYYPKELLSQKLDTCCDMISVQGEGSNQDLETKERRLADKPPTAERIQHE